MEMSGGDKGALAGTDRFVLERCLGAGGMGVVYAAVDRERDRRVALKMLRQVDADGIYYLKREFRALADVVHPNLVELHELHSIGEQWFFTMELVEGVDVLRYVRADAAPQVLPGGVSFRRPDLRRLRSSLRQLAAGIIALHARGKLHRDIKPGNVLVAPDGRVVLLDFGLVRDLTHNRLYQTAEPRLVGTPAYLSPEQAAEQPLSPASDWYSVGALLYEALAGAAPFTGNLVDVLMGKQTRDPPPPTAVAGPVASVELEALCMALLRRSPADRPDGEEIMRCLDADEAAASTPDGAPVVGPAPEGALPAGDSGRNKSGPTPAPSTQIDSSAAPSSSGRVGGSPLMRTGSSPAAGVPWVGRTQHLAVLRRALAATEQGRPVVVFAHGASGMGKSVLCQRFLEEIGERTDVVVLAGRCYERELLPYRALDSLVDALARYLMNLPPSEAEVLVPRDAQALVRLFPVLRRADVLRDKVRRPTASGAVTDRPELRRRAFTALRDLCGRLAERKTLVLYIDDLQWGDSDSAMLLRHLLAPPDAPPVLALFSYRSEDADSPCVASLLKMEGEAGPLGGQEAQRRELHVGALTPGDARALALALLPESTPDRQSCAEAIGRESAGSPYFAEELVKHVRSGGPASSVTLEEVLRSRIASLEENARRMVEALAVAARPLGRTLANRVAGLPPGDEHVASLLRSAHLLRTRSSADVVEIAHDRLRAAVVAAMPPERVRATHLRLADVLAAPDDGRDVDPELVAVHLEGAGERARAHVEAARAAARADEALAFDRAANLYRWALTLSPAEEGAAPADVRERAGLQARLGDALANLGRGVEAAEAYLKAVRGSTAADALELKRRAAEQLLRVGWFDQGVAALRTVLQSIGLDLSPTPRRGLLSLVLRRALIRLRGLSYHERDPSEIAAHQLTRLDVFWSVSTALGNIDNVRANDFQTRHLLLALKLGEPYRIGRALAAEAAYSATRGLSARGRTGRLVRTAEEIAEKVNRPFARGWATLAAGMAAYLEGRPGDARVLCERAEAVFRGCTGVWWEVGSARLFSLWSLFYLGEIGEMSRRLPAYLEEAEQRGDAYTAICLRTSVLNWHWLAADAPGRALAEVDDVMRGWSRQGFHSQHFWHMVANVNARLYCGDAEGAYRRVREDWVPLSQSLLLRVQIARIESFDLRARSALAVAQTMNAAGEREPLLRQVERDMRSLRREGTPTAHALAQLLESGRLALASGDREEARRALAQAEQTCRDAGMALHAAVARRRAAAIGPQPDRVRALAEADTWFAAQGIKNPARAMATLTPGF